MTGPAAGVTKAEVSALVLTLWFAALLYGLVGGDWPWVSPDTASYRNPGWGLEAWGRPRHPLYGWLLDMTAPSQLQRWQQGLFELATGCLHVALRGSGLRRRAAWAVTLAILASNLALLWQNALIPELMAAAFALFALAALIRLLTAPRAWLVLAYGLALGLAVSLRPSLLPAVVIFPLAAALLAKRAGATRPWRLAAMLLLAGALPCLATAELRQQAVGDFNIVSFGGFQMAGMAGLMLDDSVIARMEGPARDDAAAILALRQKLEAAGRVIATPENSSGTRSFTSAALGYFDLYARTHDALLYEGIATLQDGQNWVAFNRRMQAFARATLVAAPDRYAAWVVGATIRAVGRLTVANLPFMLGCLALAVLLPLAAWQGRAPAPDPDTATLLILAAAWTLSAGALAVLTTFPAARYMDSAGLLLGALPIHLALRLWPPGRH